jgi:5-methylcytosine-specific restriction endonuclease McrA
MQEHRIVPWQESIHKLIGGSIRTLETTWDGETFTIPTPSTEFQLPSVAQLTNKIPFNKKGVKFSRINVLTRDNFTCQYCGDKFARRELTYDHVVPRRAGGKTVWENIVSACLPCNSRKGGRTPEQAKMHLIQPPFRPKSLPLTSPAIPIAKVPEEWRFYLSEQVLAAFG